MHTRLLIEDQHRRILEEIEKNGKLDSKTIYCISNVLDNYKNLVSILIKQIEK